MRKVYAIICREDTEVTAVFNHKEDALVYEESIVRACYPYCDTLYNIVEVDLYENNWRDYLNGVLEAKQGIQALEVVRNVLAHGGSYHYEDI